MLRFVLESWLNTSSNCCNSELLKCEVAKREELVWVCSRLSNQCDVAVMWINLLWFWVLLSLMFSGFCFYLSKMFPRKPDRGPALAHPVFQSRIPGFTSWFLLLYRNVWREICLALFSKWGSRSSDTCKSAKVLEVRCTKESRESSAPGYSAYPSEQGSASSNVPKDTWSDNGV